MSDNSNCIRSSEKYWALDISDLFSHTRIIPTDKMSLGGKLNSILRLSLIIFLVMLCFSYDYSIHFLFISIIINIVFYLKYKNDY